MSKIKVLIVVTTYPLPSRSYDELVCTAGLLENGEWIRIYPVPLSFLHGQKSEGAFGKSVKYTWIELTVRKRTDDFRPESHSPLYYDFRDLVIHEPRLGTEHNWWHRKQYCLKQVYTNLERLIQDSKPPRNRSLATFKPSKLLAFEWEEDDPEWKNEWKDLRKQTDLFSQGSIDPHKLIPKVPFKFFYKLQDDAGKVSRMMIEDWEIGQLYWNCVRNADKTMALEKVRQKFFNEFRQKDLYLFLGTTREWHQRRAPNPFVIIGVFYPPVEVQGSLF